MENWQGTSALTALLQPTTPLPTSDKRLTVAYLSISEDDLMQMKPLITNLSALGKQFQMNSEPWAAAHALLAFVHNVRLLSNQPASFQQQAECLAEVKTWIPWMPRAIAGMERRDLQYMTIMAYFHAVAIAAGEYLPDVRAAIFLHKRGEIVGNIWNELLRQEASQTDNLAELNSTQEAIRMVVVPLVYAVRHRLRHAASGGNSS